MLDRITTIILLLICLALSAVILVRFTHSSSESAMAPLDMAGRTNETSVVNVAVQEVKRTTFERTTTLGGELISERDAVSITSTLSGKVTEVFVQEGQAVSKGDPIAVIDPSTAAASTRAPPSPARWMESSIRYLRMSDSRQPTGHCLPPSAKSGPDDRDVAFGAIFVHIAYCLEASFTTAAWPSESHSATVTQIGDASNYG